MNVGGKALRILIDTGSNRNYIKPSLVSYPAPIEKPFQAVTVRGNVKITHYKMAHLFNVRDVSIKFFLLPTLKSFDAILGNDILKELKAVIHTLSNYMIIKDNVKVIIKEKKYDSINNICPRTDHLSDQQKNNLENLLKNFPNLFTKPDEKLTYTTNVTAEIITNNETPVCSKFYQYPMSLKYEVNKQVSELLANGIKRPSRSPYNSSVWIVPKKLDASNEKKHRMVIDYRKLNKVTIADKYHIPEINEVLAQLGNNKLFPFSTKKRIS